MKFSILLLATAITLIVEIITLRSESKSKSEAKTNMKSRMKLKTQGTARNRLAHQHHLHKANSMMSYLSSLSNEDTNLYSEEPAAAAPKADAAPASAPAAAPAASAATPAADAVAPAAASNSTGTHTAKKGPYPKNYPKNIKDELLEDISDFLYIASNTFRDQARYPQIRLPTGEFSGMNLNEYDFRINDAYVKAPEKSSEKDVGPSKMHYFFRLIKHHLYYSPTKQDMNVLGEINIKSIKEIGQVQNMIYEGKSLSLYCITLQDYDSASYRICSEEEDVKNKWDCKIRLELNFTASSYCFNDPQDDDENDKPITKRYINQPIVVIPTPSRFCNADWNYRKKGADWECDCKDGSEQSPINLPIIKKAIKSPVKPLFQYEEVSAINRISTIDGQLKEKENLKMKLSENTFKIVHDSFGKVITLDKSVYRAQEIVIHVPGEHTINGKKYDMELQVIHYGVSKGDIGKQMILTFLFEKKAGIYNKFIDDLDIFNLPSILNPEVDIRANLFLPKIFYESDDPRMPIMPAFSFYTYQGSLTAPPCTESTIIYVASEPLYIGTTALNLFKEALRTPDMRDKRGNIIVSDWLPESNRDIQPKNGRPVFHYDHTKYCIPEPKLPTTNSYGHYEKYNKILTKYFYVNSQDPSGVPNAYVVSEKEAYGVPFSLGKSS